MLLTANEEALLAVSVGRGTHSSLWQHQLNPPRSHQEEIRIQRREQVKAADWFNGLSLGFISCRKGNQFCSSRADGERNKEHLHNSKGRESTSVLESAHCGKAFLAAGWEISETTNNSLLKSRERNLLSALCSKHSAKHSGKLLAIHVGISSPLMCPFPLRRLSRELLLFISQKATSLWKTNTSTSKQQGSKPSKTSPSWDITLNYTSHAQTCQLIICSVWCLAVESNLPHPT